MNVASELVDAARALLARQPALDPSTALRRVLQDDPALLARWHAGEAAVPPALPMPAADPGALLLAAIGARMSAGMSREEATAKAIASYPALASAHHAGRLIPQQGEAATTIVRFRSPLEGDLLDAIEDRIVKGVEIFRVGEWNGRRYSAKALDDMVQAFDEVGYRPPITLGHHPADDAPAHGYVARLYRQGDVLLADLAGVPATTIEAIRSGRIMAVSAEIYLDLKRNGKTFPHAVRALSLLGAHPPGVNLRPIAEALPAAA